ncbi:MAG TPA: ATP-binding protein [Ktedonobacteraceae bacterium]|nr:ATP-binding protein [Ktedonobacteraceae bacterium]
MSTAIWGEPEPQAEEQYPLSLLKTLLHQMMRQFGANGAVIALYDEFIGQMVVRLHMRLNTNHSRQPFVRSNSRVEGVASTGPLAHTTGELGDPSASAIQRLRHSSQPLEHGGAPLGDVEMVSAAQAKDLFPPGAAYPYGMDLIGYTWRRNESIIVRHQDYVASLYAEPKAQFQSDIMPGYYLSVPVQEPALTLLTSDGTRDKKNGPDMLGVIVLYTFSPGLGFQQRHRQESLQFAERIALYIQNNTLLRVCKRSKDYMQKLQHVSMAFPTGVNLTDLVEEVYRFVTGVVDVSSMLLTLYDRDTRGIYDILAVDKGKRIAGILDNPQVAHAEDRPVWWRVTQVEKKNLQMALGETEHSSYGEYEELLKGAWGDQTKAESFLLLPMKMFTRVVGSLCITSDRPRGYGPEEVLVLETMLQIATVSIENARLYEKSRQSLRKAKQREESLAAMNSALLAISTVLNLTELLHKFVETVATLVQAEMCTFFQLSDDQGELIAQAIYDATGEWNKATRRGDPSWAPGKEKQDDLIEMIRLPFKGSILERQVEAESFFYLDADKVEEIAQISGEGGAIFLHETKIEKMLMLPVRYQTEIVGILAVHTPGLKRVFRPEEVGVLLAISAQAASAIRNAQLFEKIQLAYAELQRMDRLKDEFIVTASHELRTPLSAISGYASLLKRQSGRISPQQVQRYASKIAGSTQQLIDLVANMTEAAKMGALEKKHDLQLSPVQVLAAAEVATTMLSINIEQQIIVQIAHDLWVNCDALLLRQVITNLLDNAAKYSPPSGRIIIAARAATLAELQLPEDQVDYTKLADGEDPPVVQVRVIDEGEGIPLEDQQRIFEKFVRATRSLTTPVRGSGLGLYICRHYIEAMGGKLWLEQSIPQRGSVFSFYLPRIDAPIDATEKDEADEPAGETN